MALKPKTGSLRIRIDPELLERYRVACEKRGWTVSDGIRRHMHDVVGPQYQRSVAHQEASESPEPSSPPPGVQKTAEEAPGKPEGPLARKRRLEKEAKALKMAKREERR